MKFPKLGGCARPARDPSTIPHQKREKCECPDPRWSHLLVHKAPACLPVSLAAMGPVGGTTSPAPTASILLGLTDVLVRRPCTAVLVAWVASARGRSACRSRRKRGQKKVLVRQRSPQPRRKQARAHRQVKGLPDSLLRLRRLASSFALRRAGPFVSSKERTFGRPEGS